MLEREGEEKEEALIGRVDVIRARIHVEEANAVSVSLFFLCGSFVGRALFGTTRTTYFIGYTSTLTHY